MELMERPSTLSSSEVTLAQAAGTSGGWWAVTRCGMYIEAELREPGRTVGLRVGRRRGMEDRTIF